MTADELARVRDLGRQHAAPGTPLREKHRARLAADPAYAHRLGELIRTDLPLRAAS